MTTYQVSMGTAETREPRDPWIAKEPCNLKTPSILW